MPGASEQAALDVVDERALAHVLEEWVGPFAAMELSLLAGGASNLTYRVDIDGSPYVLRRRPLGASAPKAHDMGREYRVLNALQGRALPVPPVFGYSEDEAVVGAPFYLMGFTEGIVVHDAATAASLDPGEAKAASLSMVETLSALHEISENDLGLERFGRPDGFLGRRIGGWLSQWRSVEHRELPAVDSLGAVMLEHLPAQRYTGLVHGDYRLGNVILDPARGARVSAVLDWEMSTIGDPLTDVAHLLVYWEPTRGRVTHPAQLISSAAGFLRGSELVDEYERVASRQVDDLPFYLAFEHWRAAIIKDAIYLRRRSGAMGSPDDTETFGATVALHLDECAELLRGEGIHV